MANIQLVGVLNITPDSFSDGGEYTDPKRALTHAESMIGEGASLVDIGADSTRKGSVCIGESAEWQRLSPVISVIGGKIPLSVDTHFVSTARRAIHEGVTMINDVSGGSKEMFELVADTDRKIVIMHSRCAAPHDFSAPNPTSVLDSIRYFFDRKLQVAQAVGLPRSRVLFDPGMGFFISDDAADSEFLVKNMAALKDYMPLYVGVSRKNFLYRIALPSHLEDASQQTGIKSDNHTDQKSALVAHQIVQSFAGIENTEIYFRVHNVGMHRQVLLDGDY